MELSEKDKKRIAEEEAYRKKLREEEEYRKQLKQEKIHSHHNSKTKRNWKKIIIITLVILAGLYLFGLLVGEEDTSNSVSERSNPTNSPVNESTPTPAYNVIQEKFMKTTFEKDKSYTIRGVQFKVGEPSDYLVDKVGKPIDSRQTTDSQYGLISEYKYETHTAMLARLDFIAPYYIIFAIYPNEEW